MMRLRSCFLRDPAECTIQDYRGSVFLLVQRTSKGSCGFESICTTFPDFEFQFDGSSCQCCYVSAMGIFRFQADFPPCRLRTVCVNDSTTLLSAVRPPEIFSCPIQGRKILDSYFCVISKTAVGAAASWKRNKKAEGYVRLKVESPSKLLDSQLEDWFFGGRAMPLVLWVGSWNTDLVKLPLHLFSITWISGSRSRLNRQFTRIRHQQRGNSEKNLVVNEVIWPIIPEGNWKLGRPVANAKNFGISWWVTIAIQSLTLVRYRPSRRWPFRIRN